MLQWLYVVVTTVPGFTEGAITIVGMRLLVVESLSSNVMKIAVRPALYSAESSSAATKPLAQASPVETEQSCIEWHKFGTIIVNLADRFGVAASGTSRVAHEGRSTKYAAG